MKASSLLCLALILAAAPASRLHALIQNPDSAEIRQRWGRETVVTGDVAVDYLRIEIPDVQPGDYSVMLTVTNPVTGATASSARAFRFIRGSR